MTNVTKVTNKQTRHSVYSEIYFYVLHLPTILWNRTPGANYTKMPKSIIG